VRSTDRSGDCPLVEISIRHRTIYRYRRPVSLGPHRLMMRPRESRELRLLSSVLTLVPDAGVTWAQDVAGNAVATATFQSEAESLLVESRSRVELSASAYPVFAIAADAVTFPFRYTDDEWADLGALTVQQYPESAPSLRGWAQGFVAASPTDTLSLLKDLNAGVGSAIAYQAREDEGTQSPIETLSRRMGSCRDLATLLVEAVRSLGFGARLVSGYLHDPSRTLLGSADAGATHAWAQIFLPGAGWITFDPTNRTVGGANLIPVAVARDIRLAMPLSGSYAGPADAFLDMSVQVSVDG
jgi:transglutaminase-like putative cysteine protease